MEQIGKIDQSGWFYQNVVERRVALGYVAAAVFLVFACPTRLSVFLGFLPAVLGEAIRTWSSGVIVKNKALATEGPYSLVRNPLYVGNFLIGLGGAIMSGRVFLVALFLALFIPVYRGLVASEEKYLLGRYGETFEEYC
ncbi:MAG: isoprenylcysteine carboxylmethyltransferase family protein, partial [Deltaproteobacteria bacterium]|nr:isoprenylcysteine carboxylmethyltransferase family protein [Deltaproteobacteria bacterium]